MKKLGLLTVTLALSINAPAFAHDPATVDVDGDSAPNAMGIQMCTGPHMTVTQSRPQTPQDIERAHDVIETLRRVLAKYHDSRVALSEGYQIFLPTVPQEVYHFTDYSAAQQEYMGNSDPARPARHLLIQYVFVPFVVRRLVFERACCRCHSSPLEGGNPEARNYPPIVTAT